MGSWCHRERGQWRSNDKVNRIPQMHTFLGHSSRGNKYLGSGSNDCKRESYESELHAEELIAFNDGFVLAVVVMSR